MKQFLFLCLFVPACLLPSQTPQFRHYTVNDGLANSMVYYAMQDSKGFIWFCTESGINRFDGHSFEVFTIKDGLADNENFRCLEDKKGRIWFASYNGRLSYFNGKSFINEKQDPTLAYNTDMNRHIMDLTEDEEGNIWFTRFLDEAVYKYDGKKITWVKKMSYSWLPNKLLFNYRHTINYFRCAPKNIYWINLTTGKETFIEKHIATEIINTCRQYIGNDFFYFNTSAGLAHFKNDSIYYDIKREELGLSDDQKILAFKITGNDLWLAASRAGLFLIPDFKTKGFTGTYRHFLDSLTISSVITDNEGGIWITSLSEGVFYLPASTAYITNMAGEAVTSIKHSDHSDMLAIGSYYGNLRIDSGGKVIGQIAFDLNYPARIKGLKWLNDRELLVGTDFSAYIYNVSTGRRRFMLQGEHFEQGHSDIDEGEAGIWVEARSGIVLIRHGKPEEIFRLQPHKSEKLVSLAEGGANGCWFTSIRNLYWFELATKKALEIAGPATFNSNLKDLGFVNGCLWVATDGNGLFIFKDGKLIRHLFSGNTAITSDMCRKLHYDGHKAIWVATNKGITVFDALTFQYVMSLTSDDILINNDIRDLDVRNGKAYVATPAGISIIDINKFVAVSTPPKLYIRHLIAAGVMYNQLTPPAFNYHNGVIKLAYAAITFQANQSLRYRYKIKKEGNSWNETPSDQLEFYNLNPGQYTVLVSAKKYNSNWCQPVAYSFTILPLWYQSGLFKLAIILFFLLGIVFIAYRVVKANKQKSETRRQILESELKAIRLHMNPHFIFNTLNSLQYFIFKNRSLEANHYIAQFAQLIRWIMSYSDKQEITLKEELDFLNTYIELEQLRFEEKFSVTLEIDPGINVQHTCIPPLVIQPFVENAIKYGLAGRSHTGSLQLIFRKQGELMLVTIEDDGVGRDQVKKEQESSQKKAESTGIKYTEERLKLLMSHIKVNAPVTITDLFDGQGKASGTRADLILPILL